MSSGGEIAIVGLACRYPGARDVAQFWANLRAGRDTLHRFSRGELLAAGMSADLIDRDDYVPVRGVLADGDRFDFEFFGYSRGEAASIDPQQRIFLECASTALDSASIDPVRFPGWIGVYAGCDLPAGPEPQTDALELATQSVIGYEKDFLATRTAYKLGLKGPAVTVQTACSTSLVAVHTACRSLLGYECDAAIAGGAALQLPQNGGYLYRAGLTRSRDGRCRPFDRDATGTVPSSGVGVVILKRLADALEARDHITAVIAGSAINNDGGEKIGYTAPSVTGQRDCIRLAYALADIDPADVRYVEAHGTGTRVGDPVEFAALAGAFRDSASGTGYCGLGAVKSNIGHTGAAAGVAGLIKSALMLHHRELVPIVHFEHANPGLELEESPFRIVTRRERWPGSDPLLAGVSSFGFGGTNAHVVLRAAAVEASREEASGGPTILCLSAASSGALRTMRNDVAAYLRQEKLVPVTDVAWSLVAGRRAFPYRACWRVDDRDHAVGRLEADTGPSRTGSQPQVGFLFPGQGALRAGCGRAAHAALPDFRTSFDEVGALIRDRYHVNVDALLDLGTDQSWFLSTEHQQFGLFTLGYALARQFLAWGVTPAAMIGHSIGEYVAATVSGSWSLADALGLVRARGRAMQATSAGRMVAVELPAAEAQSLAEAGGVWVAVRESRRVVLSGDADRITRIFMEQRERGVPVRLLDTERAFHSPFMAPAADALREAFAQVDCRPPGIPFVSCLTGSWAEPESVRSPGYWVDQLLGTIRLDTGMACLLESGCTLFVELGPGRGMTGALRRQPGWDDSRAVVPLLGGSPEHERTALLDAVARLWERGVPGGAETCLSAVPDRRRRPLPPHPLAQSRLPVLSTRVRAAAVPPRAPAASAAPALSAARWSEVATAARLPFDAVLVMGEGTAPGLAGLLGAAQVPVTHVDFDGAGAAAAAEFSRSGPRDPVVVAVPGPALDRALGVLDSIVESGTALIVIAPGTANVLGGEPIADPSLACVAWAEQRSRSASAPLALLDAGIRELPPALPVIDPAVCQYAWRGRRWWGRSAHALPLPGAPAEGTFAIISGHHRDGARLAAELAGRGLRVGALAAVRAPHPNSAVEAAVATVPWQSVHPQLMDRDDLDDMLARYSRGLIGRFVVQQAGLLSGPLPAEEVRKRIDPDGRHPRFVNFQLGVLEREGWIVKTAEGLVHAAADGAAGIEHALRAVEGLSEMPGLIQILRHVTDAYPDVFAGVRSALSVVFPDGQPDLVDRCIADNRVATSDARAALAAMRGVIRSACAAADGRRLRILEFGVGGGGLTWPLLEDWADRRDVEYHVTDISPLIVRKAQARAGEHGLSDMRFSAFDVGRDPVSQGLAAGSYDLIVGYNALHAAPSIPEALGGLSRLLAPGGHIGVVELTRIPLWAHVMWGLVPGWWDFKDELRTDSVHLDAAGWMHALRDVAGLSQVCVVPASLRSDHIVAFAAAPGRDEDDVVDRAAARLGRQTARDDLDGFILLPGADPDSADACARVLARCRTACRQHACVITEDTDRPGARLARRRLDPDDADPHPAWRHVEAARLGDPQLDLLTRVLASDTLPPVVRIGDAAARAENPADSAGQRVLPAAPEPAASDPVLAQAELVWCEVLGLPLASDADNFYAFGGDSLMIVQLLAAIRDRIGAAIPVSEITADLTFASMVALVRAHQRPAAHAGARRDLAGRLVELRATGDKRPLFFLPPAAGTTLCYQRLAPLLDSGRPFYGIESYGLYSGEPLRRMEDIGADVLGVIRQVQPRGPYLLGGWSFGAMVSHEVARQLTFAGETVDLLIGVDGFQPNTGGWPLWTRPSLMAGGRWLQVQASLGLGIAPRARYRVDGDVASIARIADLARVADRAGMPRYVPVHNANIDAMLRYRPRPVSCDMLVLKTGAGAARCARLGAKLSPLYRTVTVRPLPGNHWTVLDQPALGAVATEIRAALRAVEEASPDDEPRSSEVTP